MWIYLTLTVVWVSSTVRGQQRPARGGLEYKIPYKNGHLSLYESRRTISDISTARSFCEGRGELLASGVPEATLQNVTRTKRGMRDAWINDCYTRTEWLNGDAFGVNGGYSDTLTGDRCYQLGLSKGMATGSLITKSCGEQSSVLCSHPVKGAATVNDQSYVISSPFTFEAARRACGKNKKKGDLLVLSNIIKEAPQLRLPESVDGNYWIGLRSRQLCSSVPWINREDTSYRPRRTDDLKHVLCNKEPPTTTIDIQTSKQVSFSDGTTAMTTPTTTTQPTTTTTETTPATIVHTTTPSLTTTTQLTKSIPHTISLITTKLQATSSTFPTFSRALSTDLQFTLKSSVKTSYKNMEDQTMTSSSSIILTSTSNVPHITNQPDGTSMSSGSLTPELPHMNPNTPSSSGQANLSNGNNEHLDRKSTSSLDKVQAGDSDQSEKSGDNDETEQTLYIVSAAFASFILVVIVIGLIIWKKRRAIRFHNPHKILDTELSSVENPSYVRKPERRGTIPICPGAVQVDTAPPLPAPRNSIEIDKRTYNEIYSEVGNEFDRVELFETDQTQDDVYSTAGEYVDFNMNNMNTSGNSVGINSRPGTLLKDDLYDVCIPVADSLRKDDCYIEPNALESDTSSATGTENSPEGAYDMPPDEADSSVYHDLEKDPGLPGTRLTVVYHDLEQSAERGDVNNVYHDLDGDQDTYYSTACKPELENSDIYDECEPVKLSTYDKNLGYVSAVGTRLTNSNDPTNTNKDDNIYYDLPPE